MLALRLPEDIERRLDRLSAFTGRSKTFYATQAVELHLDDLEDVYLAEQRLAELRAGTSHTERLADVEKALGLGR